MHNAAKMFLGIGAVGLIISVAVFGFSANQLTQIEDDMDIYWGDWIVYQGGNGDIYLDNEIGYTVYVDKSYDCSVSVSAQFNGRGVKNTTKHTATHTTILTIGCSWAIFTPQQLATTTSRSTLKSLCLWTGLHPWSWIWME